MHPRERKTDATLLLQHVLEWPRAKLVTHADTVVSEARIRRYVELCERRAQGVPIPYLTCFAGFFGREFFVNEHVLVPRPETEHLIEDALTFLREINRERLRVFEAGVGSGAIACTLAAEEARVFVEGSDVSEEALTVARRNAHRLDVMHRCNFFRANIVGDDVPRGEYDLVIANLPYIPSRDLPQAPDPVAFEPRVALDGGPDGLLHYRALLGVVPGMLRPGGLLLMEAAPPTIGQAVARHPRCASAGKRGDAARLRRPGALRARRQTPPSFDAPRHDIRDKACL